MRSLVALALLVVAVTAHHAPEHQLTHPKFVPGMTHFYDVTFNITSGVPGMHSQVSTSLLTSEVRIYAKTAKELFLSMHKVRISGSLPGVDDYVDPSLMKDDTKLEEHLKVPIKFVYEHGKVTSYTLDENESLRSKKIKKSVLRNLEIYLDEKKVQAGQTWWPLTYNRTLTSPVGNYSSHYIVTASPYAEFPKDQFVFNISRTDNFEVVPYLAYETYHNFESQGCPEVCKKNQVENRFAAGCPVTYEPYQAPMKRSFVQQHNIRRFQQKDYVIDIVKTKETHVADLYDQNMQVVIRTVLKLKKIASSTIPEPSGQKEYKDLDDYSQEINEREVIRQCRYPDPKEAITAVKTMLKDITEIVITGDVEGERPKKVGELLILLQKALTVLKQADLKEIQETIINFNQLPQASPEDKVKRQIWLDNLPVIGTSESISYIVNLIEENLTRPNKAISLWESIFILESMPENILKPDEKTVTELSRLLELLTNDRIPGFSMYYSAAHLTVARVIRNMCAVHNGIPHEEREGEHSDNSLPHILRKQSPQAHLNPRCPKSIVKKFLLEVAEKLKTTDNKARRIIYIETLARTGLQHVLPYLTPFVNGQVDGFTRSYTDYLKTVAIYALHNVVTKHPRDVQSIVLPIFFNKTEPAKVRTAAFSVYIKSQPTLGSLQHVADLTWKEDNEEVGSYVTSTLETYGNASSPCQQLTALRIKKVLPQVRRFDNGRQHSKNILWDMFDSVRGFGFYNRFEYIPSNESFIPSVIYGALGYNADALRDIFFQYSMNVQGLSSRNVWDSILAAFELDRPTDIPKQKEREIFPEMNIAERIPEYWRFTTYEKLFYASSYYYMDGEESNMNDIVALLRDQMMHYFKIDSQGNTKGHLIRVFIPSSYRTKSIGQSLTYPIEFEMRNPMLFSLKLELKPTSGGPTGYEIDAKPSVYYSNLYTNQMLNLGDCKDVGVYHEKRVAATYPIVVRFEVNKQGKVFFSYKFPELPKKIFTYHSEAGTFAGQKKLTVLPPMQDRRTIKTLPSQFKRQYKSGMIGLPPFVTDVLTEDIQYGTDEIPSTTEEAVNQYVQHFLNAGWRRKSINITRIPESNIWSPNTEVKLNLEYLREFVTAPQPLDIDWSSELKFDDPLSSKDTKDYAKEGQIINDKLVRSISHIRDNLKIKVEQVDRSKSVNVAEFSIDHRHTIGGMLHLVHMNASANVPKFFSNIDMSADYAILFVNRPNEFKYNEQNFGKQKGLALGAVTFSKVSPFRNPIVIAKSVFDYKPLEEVLKHEMQPVPERKYFLPESHESCLRDVREGKALSVNCIKAVREWAIYNHMKIHALWSLDLPPFVTSVAHKIDLAFKRTYFTHMQVYKKPVTKEFRLDTVYIDKMTDEPVADILLVMPSEVVKYKKISASWIQPLSSIDSIVDTMIQQWTNNTYLPTCAVMDKYVRTYDLRTYPLPADVPSCDYVVSTHCTEYKKFAVLAKIEPGTGTKRIHMYVGEDEIVLTLSSRKEYTVEYNKQPHTVNILNPIMMNERDSILAFVKLVSDGTYNLEVQANKAGVKVVYDGKNVKVQVHPRYKGELCGLCSEFDGVKIQELRGVDQCLYSSPSDFAKNSIVGSCGNKQPVYPYLCHTDDAQSVPESQWNSWGSQENSEEDREEDDSKPLKRTAVLIRSDMICFSTTAVPVCKHNRRSTRSHIQKLGFHCLPKNDSHVRELVGEAKRRILAEMEGKKVDIWEEFEVAGQC